MALAQRYVRILGPVNNMLKTIQEGKVQEKKVQEEDKDVDIKITYESGHDIAWLSTPPRQRSEKSGDSSTPTFVPKSQQKFVCQQTFATQNTGQIHYSMGCRSWMEETVADFKQIKHSNNSNALVIVS